MRYKQDHQKYAQMSAICKPKLKCKVIQVILG